MNDFYLRREFLLHALGVSDKVLITINANDPDCVIPKHLRGLQLFELGLGLTIPTSIATSARGWSSRLSFNRTPFDCYVPWGAVLSIAYDGGGAAFSPVREFDIRFTDADPGDFDDEPTPPAGRHLRIVK